jgi:hypothetical protein
MMRTLRAGSRGEDVRVWQEFLKSRGLYAGLLDGQFGDVTLAASKAFQLAEGLTVDGFVGNRTLGKAMLLGLDFVPEDPPLPGGPAGGASSLGDAWEPPPPPQDAAFVVAKDPRVITHHHAGQLPCPPNPPPPVGWKYWQGSVPKAFVDFAVHVEFTPETFPIGSFVQASIDGRLVAARVEWHSFQGATGKRGCFRGTNLFRHEPLERPVQV